MTRKQLEHVIRAAGAIAEVDALVVVGSQAILGAFPDAPIELLTSMEADIYPEGAAHLADVIDGAIGEGSPFHEEFGYYAHGVGPETAALPSQWRKRAVVISNRNTRHVKGICPGPVDLAVSKLIAGRGKDIDFVKRMVTRGLVFKSEIERAAGELSAANLLLVRERLAGLPG
jgi:hypothetical protein